jgi:hypothetical protein
MGVTDRQAKAHNPAAVPTRHVADHRSKPPIPVVSREKVRRLWPVDNHSARLLRCLVLTGFRIGVAQRGYRRGERRRDRPAAAPSIDRRRIRVHRPSPVPGRAGYTSRAASDREERAPPHGPSGKAPSAAWLRPAPIRLHQRGSSDFCLFRSALPHPIFVNGLPGDTTRLARFSGNEAFPTTTN